jgi:serine/threonine protein kinase
MSIINIWEKYSKEGILGSGTYSLVYRAKNIETGNYVAIKEINKQKYDTNILKEKIKKMKINSENSIMINEIIDADKSIYLIMDLCLFNLEEYINMRKEHLSIDEIKKILLDLNKSLKIMKEKEIIHGNIKLSNILISLNQFNQLSFNLCIYDSIQFINQLDSKSISNQKPILSKSPEFLKGEDISNKSDVWSLGIIIYYMLFNKFPYDGKTEYQLYQNIISNQNKINNIEDKELKDLLIKM